jgi:8-oxo-dGTP pyrophosphatase MutT (NUDIX family)
MPGPGPLVELDSVPGWLRCLVAATSDVDPAVFGAVRPAPAADSRRAAVLLCFGETPEAGPDVLLLRRADTLGSHAGQVAFPGGGAEQGDDGPVATALREAVEEVGLAAGGIRPLALMPALYVPVSGFAVTPVVSHWQVPSPVRVVDPAETAAVARVSIASLLDPRRRCAVRVRADYVSPAFLVPGMLIWGFTAALLTAVLTLSGWDTERVAGEVADVRSLERAWQDAMALPRGPGPSVAAGGGNGRPHAAGSDDGSGVHGVR